MQSQRGAIYAEQFRASALNEIVQWCETSAAALKQAASDQLAAGDLTAPDRIALCRDADAFRMAAFYLAKIATKAA